MSGGQLRSVTNSERTYFCWIPEKLAHGHVINFFPFCYIFGTYILSRKGCAQELYLSLLNDTASDYGNTQSNYLEKL